MALHLSCLRNLYEARRQVHFEMANQHFFSYLKNESSLFFKKSSGFELNYLANQNRARLTHIVPVCS